MSDDGDVWVVEGFDGLIGITSNLEVAEKVLRREFFQDTEYDEVVVGDRLTFDLKFMHWVLFLDRQPLYRYSATRVPRL